MTCLPLVSSSLLVFRKAHWNVCLVKWCSDHCWVCSAPRHIHRSLLSKSLGSLSDCSLRTRIRLPFFSWCCLFTRYSHQETQLTFSWCAPLTGPKGRLRQNFNFIVITMLKANSGVAWFQNYLFSLICCLFQGTHKNCWVLFMLFLYRRQWEVVSHVRHNCIKSKGWTVPELLSITFLFRRRIWKRKGRMGE